MTPRPHTGPSPKRPKRAPVGEEFFKRPAVAFFSGATLVGLVVLVGALIPIGPIAIDQRWTQLMSDVQRSALHTVALVFNSLGRGLSLVTITVVGILLAMARRWWPLLAFASTEALTSLTSTLIKSLVERGRPPDASLHPLGSSFPSGHAAYAGATTVALVLLYTRPGRHRRSWWALAALTTAGMAWSRTYLQVHWLTDVVAGSLLGVGLALLIFAATQIVREKSGEAGRRPAMATRRPPNDYPRQIRRTSR